MNKLYCTVHNNHNMTLVIMPYKVIIMFTNYFDHVSLVSSEAMVTNCFNHPYISLAEMLSVLSVLSATTALKGLPVVGMTDNRGCCRLKATNTKKRHLWDVC